MSFGAGTMDGYGMQWIKLMQSLAIKLRCRHFDAIVTYVIVTFDFPFRITPITNLNKSIKLHLMEAKRTEI